MENPTILYVEDDMQSREILRVLVEEVMQLSGLTIFENSQNFLERLIALSPRPDVILLDIHMVPINGFEMLKLLRGHELFKSTPVVALTASVMNEEVERLRQAGFNGVIPKPLNMDSFPSLMERIVQGEEIWNILE